MSLIENKQRYNRLWETVNVYKPEIWSTWEIASRFTSKKCLEIGSGNYPRIPLTKNSFFVDISESAVKNLKRMGLNAIVSSTEYLPFPNKSFDLVVACNVLEHTKNDNKAFSEIARILKSGGYFLFFVPLQQKYFSEFDKNVGHNRRYNPQELFQKLSLNHFIPMAYRNSDFPLFTYLYRIKLFRLIAGKIFGLSSAPQYFNLPNFLKDKLIFIGAFLERISAGRWKKFDIQQLKNKISLGILARKS